ncbi:MAG: hypothetical protein JKX99_08190 [Robiginitomaculum sp.]|nr:hypothetical protein [Robiginitomaculum sp.]
MVVLGACSAESTRWPDSVNWIAPNANIAKMLTVEPAECVRSSPMSDEIALGRIAFHSPVLLGGQAARNRISCASCHTNGQVNEHFFIAGLSNAPGTADVSNFHFSKTLGDGVFNPKPIPSLAMLDTPKTPATALKQEQFILRLIEQEFDGAAPLPQIKSALIAYVNDLDIAVCAETNTYYGQQILEHRLQRIDSYFMVLSSVQEAALRDFLIISLRFELGRLYTRFPEVKDVQAGLLELSTSVKNVTQQEQQAVQQNWQQQKPQIRANFSHSLFDAAQVSKRIAH